MRLLAIFPLCAALLISCGSDSSMGSDDGAGTPLDGGIVSAGGGEILLAAGELLLPAAAREWQTELPAQIVPGSDLALRLVMTKFRGPSVVIAYEIRVR